MLHLTFTKYTFATLLHLKISLKSKLRHIALAYFILFIIGIQTGMHFFHNHSHRISYESKSTVILSENASDCLVCSLHINNELFFINPEIVVFVNNIYINHFSILITNTFPIQFLNLQGRSPPADTGILS